MRVHMTVDSRMPRNLGSSRVYCVQITQNPGTRLRYTQPNLTLDLVDCFRMCRPLRGFERRSFKWLATMMCRISNLAAVAVVRSTDTAQANVCAKQVLTL